MANSSSEDKTDTLPERPTRIQPYQFEPVRQDFERVQEHHVDHTHTQFTEESKMATALTPQTDVTSGVAYRKKNRLKTHLKKKKNH